MHYLETEHNDCLKTHQRWQNMATADVLNPPPMYRLKPYFEIKKVKLPDCMYLLKPVHQLPNSAVTSESSSSALTYLEKRQEWVLGQITNLQDRVKVLAQQFGIGPEEVGILQQVNTDVSYQDVVIQCPTSSPPYLLAVLYKYISSCLPCTYSVHVHSSATSTITEDLKRFFDGLPNCAQANLKLTLIWKADSVCPSATMVISPHNQTPVEGIANIARYFCRHYCPSLYENQGPMAASQIDSWLEAITGTLLRGSSKEKASVVRKLNSHLGSSSYLAGNSVSIGDIVAYCVLANLEGIKPTTNVKEWIKRLKTLPYLSIVPFTSFPLV